MVLVVMVIAVVMSYFQEEMDLIFTINLVIM